MKHPRTNLQSLPGAHRTHRANATISIAALPANHVWPGSVSAPSSDLFVESAKEWLFTLGPGRWRHVPLLHRRPVLLARLVRFHLEAGMAGATVNSRTAQDELELLDIEGGDVEEFVDLSEREYHRLQTLTLQVRVVEIELQRRRRKGQGQEQGPRHT
ncbi:hypothetical protein ACFVJ4_36335 [Streptomyces sp. NPDC127178]|uniref:hypothetical protein n=1 Tax=unclassified Streptomyces TaxID=2593676 RepID=UPI0036436D41